MLQRGKCQMSDGVNRHRFVFDEHDEKDTHRQSYKVPTESSQICLKSAYGKTSSATVCFKTSNGIHLIDFYIVSFYPRGVCNLVTNVKSHNRN